MENQERKLENVERITPFDWEMIRMVESVTKKDARITPKDDVFEVIADVSELSDGMKKVLNESITGRIGKRMKGFRVSSEKLITFSIEYDTKIYPVTLKSNTQIPNHDAGLHYERRQEEIKALQVRREDFDKLKEFTGGGEMEIARTPGARAIYRFIDDKGVFVDVAENWYIILNKRNEYSVLPEDDFNRMFVRCEPVENVQELFNRLFGADIKQRFQKLDEEYGELLEAERRLFENPDDLVIQSDVIDELADVNAVLLHIANHFGVLPEQLISMAYDKVRGREEDTNYKRKHPHVEKKEPFITEEDKKFPKEDCLECIKLFIKASNRQTENFKKVVSEILKSKEVEKRNNRKKWRGRKPGK